MTRESTVLLRGATLLHLSPPRVQRADLRVAGDRIEAVGEDLEPLPDESVVDLQGKLLLPGLVCGHHHLYSALSTGMPLPSEPPESFADMLAKVWWRLDRALDAESVEVSGLVGGVLALQAGVTTIVDHHASPSYIVGSLESLDGALGSLGLRRVLCYEVSDRGGQEEAIAGLKAHENLLGEPGNGMRAVMIGGHANFTLTDASLQAMGDMAREAGTGIHIHVAEAIDDAQTTGEPLVSRLDRLGALLPGSLLVHCVHLDPQEIDHAAEAGAWVSHQPRSNMNNGIGYAPLAHFPERTILGTDGIGADMFAELQVGWFRSREADVPWTPDRFVQALAAGTTFAGERLGANLGRLEPGAAADLVVLDAVPGPPLRDENLGAAFIFRFGSAMVRHVMVAGDWRLWDREPTGIDLAALHTRASRVAPQVWDRMRDL